MRIVNATDVEISYELKGGPLKMTMSTCDLSPGEDDEWVSPYRTLAIDCEIHIQVGEASLSAAAKSDATVTVVPGDDGFVLTVS